MITQSGTADPSAISVIQDDFGNISFTRLGVGVYRITIPDAVYNETIINGINPYLSPLYPISTASDSQTGKALIDMGGGPVTSLKVVLPSGYVQSGTFFEFLTYYNGLAADSVLEKYNVLLDIIVKI